MDDLQNRCDPRTRQAPLHLGKLIYQGQEGALISARLLGDSPKNKETEAG